MPKFGVFVVRIFLYTEKYGSGKYGPEKLRIRTLFMQWRIQQNLTILPVYRKIRLQKLRMGTLFTQQRIQQNLAIFYGE